MKYVIEWSSLLPYLYSLALFFIQLDWQNWFSLKKHFCTAWLFSTCPFYQNPNAQGTAKRRSAVRSVKLQVLRKTSRLSSPSVCGLFSQGQHRLTFFALQVVFPSVPDPYPLERLVPLFPAQLFNDAPRSLRTAARPHRTQGATDDPKSPISRQP